MGEGAGAPVDARADAAVALGGAAAEARGAPASGRSGEFIPGGAGPYRAGIGMMSSEYDTPQSHAITKRSERAGALDSSYGRRLA